MPLKDNHRKATHTMRRETNCSVCGLSIVREMINLKPFTCFNCKKLKAKARYLTGKKK